MTARIIDLIAYRATHSGESVRACVVYDPLWMWRVWLACWGWK